LNSKKNLNYKKRNNKKKMKKITQKMFNP